MRSRGARGCARGVAWARCGVPRVNRFRGGPRARRRGVASNECAVCLDAPSRGAALYGALRPRLLLPRVRQVALKLRHLPCARRLCDERCSTSVSPRNLTLRPNPFERIDEKRELIFKEDGQGALERHVEACLYCTVIFISAPRCARLDTCLVFLCSTPAALPRSSPPVPLQAQSMPRCYACWATDD